MGITSKRTLSAHQIKFEMRTGAGPRLRHDKMAREKLTPKQEAFVLAYFETGNGVEAYRRAYGAKNLAPASIDTQARRSEPFQKTDRGRKSIILKSIKKTSVESMMGIKKIKRPLKIKAR